jgi:hypothetical protein
MWQRVGTCLAHCHGLKPVRGVPGLQGTDSGPRAHLRRGYEPTGGANVSFPV